MAKLAESSRPGKKEKRKRVDERREKADRPEKRRRSFSLVRRRRRRRRRATHYGTLPMRSLTDEDRNVDVEQFNPWCAETALAYYNSREYKDFELVEVMGVSAGLLQHIWIHVNFKAKPKFATTCIDTSSKLFFAELRQVRPQQLLVEACFVLEPNVCDVGKFRGCELCIQSNDISHPTLGFFWLKPKKDSGCSKRRLYGDIHLDKEPASKSGQEERQKDGRNANFEAAETALAYYNKREGVDFELVKALEASGAVFRGFWIHINFLAKPKCEEDCTDLSPKLFFAELNLYRPLQYVVESCSIMEPNGADAEGLVRCRLCMREKINNYHPSSGFYWSVASGSMPPEMLEV